MRVVSILEKSAGMDEDPKAEEALNFALDELAIARAAAAFEMFSGPINWKNDSYGNLLNEIGPLAFSLTQTR